MLCSTISEGATLWVTLEEDIGSLSGTTFKGGVILFWVVDRLGIWASWMKALVVGFSKVRDGISLFYSGGCVEYLQLLDVGINQL